MTIAEFIAALALKMKAAEPDVPHWPEGDDAEKARRWQWEEDCAAVAKACTDAHPDYTAVQFLKVCGVL